MFVRLLSDLHLEFGNFDIPPMDGDDETVLVLAGDITVGDTHKDFILNACKQFKHVIYIHGNHEYYKNEYNNVIKKWKNIASSKSNLHFLHNETVIIDHIRFIGGTMWTDFYNSDWFAMHNAKKNMNCFSSIKLNDGSNYRTLRPENTVEFHNEFCRFLETELSTEFDGKTIVISHHLPSYECVSDKFKYSSLNPAFHANMDGILEKYDIDYWFYGHTHDSQTTEIYGTPVMNNSRGYDGYEDPDENGFNPILRLKI